MTEFEERRIKVQNAMKNEQNAFERRQRFFQKIIKPLAPEDGGAPTIADIEELNAANEDYKAAVAETNFILDEFTSATADRPK
ncbi:hypothetical protein [Glaciimonas soli]|uniref:Uncharacterized protein n=1 Tax=Glaciimonas soli TaxID=2590999 RepID=A0A843YNW1_9BURK|nr:hypothetical protein [Glaciimonas soli]MQQ99242.1 hypothetical protein [Glaciimonas soli]